MDIAKIYDMQVELDKKIMDKHQLKGSYKTKKILSIVVELAELANEVRCFKFWSNKGPSEKSVILEEYVDALCFILSLCIEKEVRLSDLEYITISYNPKSELDRDFMDLFKSVLDLDQSFLKKTRYSMLLHHYISFGLKLGFTWEEIEEAYIKKNEVNHKRQENGY